MRTSTRRTLAIVGLPALAILVVATTIGMLVLAGGGHGPGGPLATPNPLPPGNDWAQFRFDPYGTGANPETQISADNVSQLGTKWTTTPTRQKPFLSAPAIVDGVIYTTYGKTLTAFNLRTGHELWHFDNLPNGYGNVFSSVAVDPKTHIAYYGTPDARVYAVSTLTHTQVWMVQLGEPKSGAFIWGSPLVVNNKVYIGLASHDDNPCVRGAVYALDAATGANAWTRPMVSEGSLGGSVWSSLSANPDAHEVIATTGNPCDFAVGKQPQGGAVDEQQDSIVGLDWDTGELRWTYNAVGDYDNDDLDFGEGPVDFSYQGQEYVVAGNKHGDIFGLIVAPSRQSVQLAWKKNISGAGTLNVGGVFQPPTYSNGIVYISGGPTTDGACRGALWAFKADTGAALWHQCTAGQVVSASAITGGVLFVAQRGVLVGYDAVGGRMLWQASLKQTKSGDITWGGIAISHGYLVIGTYWISPSSSQVGTLYCFTLPQTKG
jgi:outer membrane protein assembly factor BamB